MSYRWERRMAMPKQSAMGMPILDPARIAIIL
jgi:hypothetical protein